MAQRRCEESERGDVQAIDPRGYAVYEVVLAIQGAASAVALIWGSVAMLTAEPIDPEEEERALMRSIVADE